MGVRHWWLMTVISALEAEIGRIIVEGQPGKKVRHHPNRKSWVWQCLPVISEMLRSLK
jgi:hypothetical protein